MPIGTPTLLLACAPGNAFASGANSPAIAANAAVGSLVVVLVACFTGADETITSVGDSAGNVYTQAEQPAPVGGVFNAAIFFCQNIQHALTSGSSTFTATTSGGSQALLAAAAVSGANGGNDSNADAAANGSGQQSVTTGTLGSSSEIIFGIQSYNGAASISADSFTVLSDHGADAGVYTAYEIVSSNAPVTWNPTVSPGTASSVLAGFAADGTLSNNPFLTVQVTVNLTVNGFGGG